MQNCVFMQMREDLREYAKYQEEFERQMTVLCSTRYPKFRKK